MTIEEIWKVAHKGRPKYAKWLEKNKPHWFDNWTDSEWPVILANIDRSSHSWYAATIVKAAFGKGAGNIVEAMAIAEQDDPSFFIRLEPRNGVLDVESGNNTLGTYKWTFHDDGSDEYQEAA